MEEKRKPRRAPTLYERTVPLILGVILVLVVILGFITFAVLFGFWPAG